MNWKKIVVELAKYLVGVLAGALGVTCTGCASIPFFIF